MALTFDKGRSRTLLGVVFTARRKLGLMLKDVRIAVDGVLSLSNSSKESIFPIVERLLEKSSINEGYDADYTRVVRTLELDAGIELRETSSESTVP